MSEVKDVTGRFVKIGDTVAFTSLSRGQLFSGKVVRIHKPSIIAIDTITYKYGYTILHRHYKESNTFTITNHIEDTGDQE